MDMNDKVERLIEIREEMFELLREAEQLVRGTSEADRAHVYWLAHIKSALGSSEYRAMCSMDDSTRALAATVDEDDDEKAEWQAAERTIYGGP